LARRTNEKDCLALPTPTASDAETHKNDIQRFDSLSVHLRKILGYPSYPNPLFVEKMMGYPEGWTDLEA
jgi:hypothetical protein